MAGLTAQALTVAGSDSGGGAGIQADLKTFQMRGVYGVSVITALTAQNTLGVHAVHPVPPAMVAAQLRAVTDDFAIGAVKIGMLGSAQIIDCVAAHLPHGAPLVLDPVMRAKDGASLLADDALFALTAKLLPRTTVFTPNLPETERLSGICVQTRADAERAARLFMRQGAANVVIKGGHAGADVCCDRVFLADGRCLELSRPRIATAHTHGTGCTFSACIAAELAKGHSVADAVCTAKALLHRAIAASPNIGAGCGSVNHWAFAEPPSYPCAW